MANERLPLLPLILGNVPSGLRRALAQEGIPVRDWRDGPPRGRFLLFDSRSGNFEPPAAGQIGIDVDALRHAADDDPFDALLDTRDARFHWRVGPFSLSERVARVDKQAVRKRLVAGLRTRIERAGGIWLRVAAYPFPYRSAFNLRIDYDTYHPADFEAALCALGGNEHATSHFVSGDAYESADEALARLRGLDVGSHGYWHHTYRTAEENLKNIGRSIERLRAAGIEPSGFAAPHGRFHRELLTALDSAGIGHSSEFALAYDDLPFLADFGNVLQIPVHPVCLGLFLDAARSTATEGRPVARCSAGGFSADAAVDAAVAYFDDVARAKYHGGEPVFLYGHPTARLGRYPQVLREIFTTVSSFSAIWKTTYTELARWWRVRARVGLTVLRRQDHFEVSVEGALPEYPVGLEHCRGKHVGLVPLDRPVVRFSTGSLAYETRRGGSVVRPVRVDQAEGIRGHVRRWIDWERVTPVDEIGTGTWRNWAKRTLRRMWSY